jgi:hypothetical protein
MMTSMVTKASAIGAALFGGLLAGSTATRAFVEMPAWERIGVKEWAAFSRVENASAAFLLYPAIGAAALLLTIGTAVALHFDRTARATRRLPIYSAVAVVVVAAVVTRAGVVPALFQLKNTLDDPGLAPGLFQTLAGWWAINDLLHTLAFSLNLWALVEILTGSSRGSVLRERLTA